MIINKDEYEKFVSFIMLKYKVKYDETRYGQKEYDGKKIVGGKMRLTNKDTQIDISMWVVMDKETGDILFYELDYADITDKFGISQMVRGPQIISIIEGL